MVWDGHKSQYSTAHREIGFSSVRSTAHGTRGPLVLVDNDDPTDIKDATCCSSFHVDDRCDRLRIDGWDNILLPRYDQPT